MAPLELGTDETRATNHQSLITSNQSRLIHRLRLYTGFLALQLINLPDSRLHLGRGQKRFDGDLRIVRSAWGKF
jgi:hypothetical protein